MIKDTVDHDVQNMKFNFICESVKKLSQHSERLSEDDKRKLADALKYQNGREVFIEAIKQIKHFKCSVKQQIYDDFSFMLITFLNAMNEHKDYDSKLIYCILLFSRKIWALNKANKKTYLLATLSQCAIWQDKERWKLMTELLLKSKLKLYESTLNKGVISKIVSVVRGYSADFNSKESIIYQFLKSITFILMALKIPVQSSMEIIADCSQKFGLNTEKLNMLITDLKNSDKSITEKHIYYEVKSLANDKYCKKFGKAKGSILIYLSLKFHARAELFSVSTLSKSLRKASLEEVYRIALKKIPISLEIRLCIWEKIMELDGINRDYKAFKEKLTLEKSKGTKSTNHQIEIDINRSFINIGFNKEEYRSMMISIFELFELMFPDTEYGQGMNIVAGFFICAYKTEERIFKNFINFMYKFRFFCIFENNLEGLLQFLYELERIVSMYLPDIYYHLQVECVTYSSIATPWFLTIFTHTLQKNDDKQFPPILLAIWNMYLLDGWKAVFRAILIFFEEFQDELLNYSVEELQLNINELLTKFLSGQRINETQFNEKYSKSRVTNALIQELAKDYKNMKILAANNK